MTTIPESFGANPVNYKWTVVRGDTAVLRVEFVENDEETPFDTSTWEYEATAYDYKGDALDTLEVIVEDGYINIIASADVTANWGTGFRNTVAELVFDLQVTIDDDTIWTPIVGTIKVLADITGGSL